MSDDTPIEHDPPTDEPGATHVAGEDPMQEKEQEQGASQGGKGRVQ